MPAITKTVHNNPPRRAAVARRVSLKITMVGMTIMTTAGVNQRLGRETTSRRTYPGHGIQLQKLSKLGLAAMDEAVRAELLQTGIHHNPTYKKTMAGTLIPPRILAVITTTVDGETMRPTTINKTQGGTMAITLVTIRVIGNRTARRLLQMTTGKAIMAVAMITITTRMVKDGIQDKRTSTTMVVKMQEVGIRIAIMAQDTGTGTIRDKLITTATGANITRWRTPGTMQMPELNSLKPGTEVEELTTQSQ